jgi:hypothetical protein
MPQRVFDEFPTVDTFLQPSQTVDVAGGATETVTLAGRGDRPLGFDRILVYADGVEEQVLLKMQPNSGGFTFFEDVQASAIQDFFRHRRLQSPLLLEEGRALEIEVTNNSGSPATVTVELTALPQRVLEDRLEAVREEFGERLVPVFLYVTGTVPANANARADLLSYREYTELLRFITSSTAENEITYDVDLPARTPIRDKRHQTVLDQFESGDLQIPLGIDTTKDARLVVANQTSSQQRYTFLGECYSLPGGPLVG